MWMELPSCSIGGFFSISRMRCSASESPLQPLCPLRISACTTTLEESPCFTWMLPEPVRTSTETGSETFSVRSNEPSAPLGGAAHAAAAMVAARTTVRNALVRMPANPFMFCPPMLMHTQPAAGRFHGPQLLEGLDVWRGPE